jgi:hypothetical protein
VANRHLANYRIDPVIPTSCIPDRNWDRRSRLGNYLHRHQANRHRARRSQQCRHRTGRCTVHVARFVVKVVESQLLQPVRQAKATLRGSAGNDPRHDRVINYTAPDKLHQNMLQVRAGNATLQLQKQTNVTLQMQKQTAVCLRAAVVALAFFAKLSLRERSCRFAPCSWQCFPLH